MFAPRAAVRALAVLFGFVWVLLPPHDARAQCDFCTESLGPSVSSTNTFWSLRDSVAACPAGDTVDTGGHVGHPHPSRLRIEVWYADASCLPKQASRRSRSG